MQLTIIAAMDRNRVIGKHGGVSPWHLPRDTHHFRLYTQGKHLLLGRRTFEEMTGWLTNQTPIVMTSQRDYQVTGGWACQGIEGAIQSATERGIEELVVCGGAEIYAAALPHTDKLLLTEVATEVEEGVQFPPYREDVEWQLVSEKDFPPDDENSFAMRFLDFKRVKAA